MGSKHCKTDRRFEIASDKVIKYIKYFVTFHEGMLWPVRVQKEDTKEEEVGRTSVLNKQIIRGSLN